MTTEYQYMIGIISLIFENFVGYTTRLSICQLLIPKYYAAIKLGIFTYFKALNSICSA